MERSTASNDPGDDTGSEGTVMRHLDPDTGRPIELFLPAAPQHGADGLPGGRGDNGSIVEWQPDDPKNPHNWPRSRKNIHLFLVTTMTALVRFNIGMIAPSQMRIMSDFGADNRHVLAGLVVSGFVLGQTAGPVLMEPLSEVLGRRAVYIVGAIGFSLCTVGCWLAWSLTSLIVFRCIAGTFGSCALAIGPRILNDLTQAEPSIVYSFCGILGFAIGPVIGGHLADALDWHMVCLISGVAATVMALAVTFLVQETYGPLLLQWEAERRRRESGNPHIRSALDRGLTPGARFRRSIVRPFAAMILTLRSFIYMAVGALAYGFLLVVLTTIGYVFAALLSEPPDRIALIYVGFSAGCLVGWMGYIATPREGNGGGPRTWPLPVGACLAVLGFLLYAQVDGHEKLLILPMTAHIMVAGALMLLSGWTSKALETLGAAASAARSASDILKCIFAGAFPLFGEKLYADLGVKKGNLTLAACVAGALLLSSFLILARYWVRGPHKK